MNAQQEPELKMWVSDLFEFFARSHMIAIMYHLGRIAEGPVRFNELREDLGISPNTLSHRLKELVDAGLVTRTTFEENPPRVQYEVTEKARALVPAFRHFHEWCMENTIYPEPSQR